MAPLAPVFWLSAPPRPALSVSADRRGRIAERDFDITRLSFPSQLLLAAKCPQILVLKSPVATLTLRVAGAALTGGPVRLTFAASSLAALPLAEFELAVLARILARKPRQLRGAWPGPAERLEWRNALIALDGERAGRRRRDIATAIFGENRVNADWAEPHGRLKAIVKRSLERGHRLLEGDFRRLLVRGSFADRS